MKARKLYLLQNCEVEGPGTLLPWALKRGLEFRVIRTREEPLPDLEADAAYVLLGAPESVNDAPRPPWLSHQAGLARLAIERGLPVLGHCLGAQLITQVLGGTIYQGEKPEIGWQPVQWESPPAPAPTRLFQWHGEGLTLPAGARALASSTAYAVQAFGWEKHVLAIGPHLEINQPLTEAFIGAFWNEERYQAQRMAGHTELVQTPAEIRAVSPAHLASSAAFAHAVYDSWLG
jgi:GMP synthase-like glutamine amidotransferase